MRDAISQCELIVSENPSVSETTAIKELKQYINKMTGARLATAGIADAGRGPHLIVGADAVKAIHPEMDLSGLGDEGFIIKKRGEHLLVAGGKLRGTMYGVYALLEELGCYWLAPGEEVIPEKKTLIVSSLNRREVPVLKQRNVMCHGTGGNPWGARNKINSPGWSEIPEEYGGTFETAGHLAHNLFKLMEEAGVEVEEEMYCLWDDKRNHTQLCLTDPRVIEAFATAQIKIAKAKPGAAYVKISREDNKIFCECDRCLKIDSKVYGKPMDQLDPSEHAGPLIYCVNEIAKKMAAEVPGTDLMFGVYLSTRTPPPHATLEPNTIVSLALIESNYMRPLSEAHIPINAKGKKDLIGWGKLADQMFMWDYVVNYNHYNMSFPNLDVLVPNVKFYVDNHVRFFMEQAAHTGANAEFSQLRRWVLAKAMWNPEANNQALITQFLNLYYGPAAPAIQEYINVTHKPSRTEIFDSGIYDWLDAPYLQANTISAAEVAMRKADKLAEGHVDCERRVRHAHLPVWYVIAHRMPGGATWKAVEAATGEPVDLVEISEKVWQIVADDPMNKYMAYADHEPFKPWVEWLKDYAAQYAAGGLPIPPELEGVDPSAYFLVQACQMDFRPRWWKKSEGASDGWVNNVPSPAWMTKRYLRAGEDFVKGRKYEVYVRIKPGEIIADSGNIFAIGSFDQKVNGYKKNPDIDVSRVMGDGFQTFKLGVAADMDGLYFSTNPKVMKSFELDCFWLMEVAKQ